VSTFWKSASLKILEHSGPVQVCNGIALSKRRYRLGFVVDNVARLNISLPVHRFFSGNLHYAHDHMSGYLNDVKYKNVPIKNVIQRDLGAFQPKNKLRMEEQTVG
jgi:hypothetical protein